MTTAEAHALKNGDVVVVERGFRNDLGTFLRGDRLIVAYNQYNMPVAPGETPWIRFNHMLTRRDPKPGQGFLLSGDWFHRAWTEVPPEMRPLWTEFERLDADGVPSLVVEPAVWPSLFTLLPDEAEPSTAPYAASHARTAA